MSLRNSFRRRARLALTLLTLSAGGLFFMSALNIRSSLVNTLDRMFAVRKFDLSVAFASPQPIEKIQRAIRNTTGVKAFEGWFSTDGSFPIAETVGNTEPHSPGLHSAAEGNDRFTIIALPAESQMLAHEIIQGRPLKSGDKDAILINNAMAKKYPQMKVGETVGFQMGPAYTIWKVVGIARETYSPPVAYIPLSFIAERHPGQVNNVRLALEKTDADSIDIVKASLDTNFEREGVRARNAVSNSDSRLGFDQHLLMIYVFLIVMSAIIGSVGGLGLMTTMSVNVLERRREMGVLRAIGATTRTVAGIVVAEGLAMGLLSWVIAALLAWPVSKVLGDALVGALFKSGLDFVFEPTGLLVWLIVSILLSSLATLVPAWKAARLTVRESLAYQ